MLVFLASLPQSSLKFPAFLVHAHLLLEGISTKAIQSMLSLIRTANMVGHNSVQCNPDDYPEGDKIKASPFSDKH